MEVVFIVLVIQGLVFGFFCSYIAKEKNRDGMSWFWLGFFFSILAIFALIAVPKIESRVSPTSYTPSNETHVKPKPNVAIFNGDRNIDNSSYQLFLTRRFSIEKNATLEKYIIGDEVFATLEDSLIEADSRYKTELAKIASREVKRIPKISELKVESSSERAPRKGQEYRKTW